MGGPQIKCWKNEPTVFHFPGFVQVKLSSDTGSDTERKRNCFTVTGTCTLFVSLLHHFFHLSTSHSFKVKKEN